jgi:hypothetical protein
MITATSSGTSFSRSQLPMPFLQTKTAVLMVPFNTAWTISSVDMRRVSV